MEMREAVAIASTCKLYLACDDVASEVCANFDVHENAMCIHVVRSLDPTRASCRACRISSHSKDITDPAQSYLHPD
jgi:hypothetical protein